MTLPGEPIPSTFGHNFNYAVWEMGTNVNFANVPWNSDYRDVVHFDTQAELDAYIVNQNGPIYSNMSYAKAYEPVRVDLPFNKVYKYNYLRVTNPVQPISGGDSAKTFYYFIDDVRYIAPNTTEVVLTLDVWQTFGRNVTFGNCYIERGHVGIANANAMRNQGRDFLTTPEGLDLGAEYEIKWTWEHKIAELGLDTGVLVMSTIDIAASGGTWQDPVITSAKGSAFEDLPNGAALYYFTSVQAFLIAMGALSQMPWITQGFISVTIIPSLVKQFNGAADATPVDGIRFQRVTPQGAPSVVCYSVQGSTRNQVINMIEDFRNIMTGTESGRYTHLHKFKTFPYSLMEITTNTGNPLVLRPELVSSNDLELVEIFHLAPPAQRIAYYPYRYNVANGTPEITQTNADGSVEVLNDGGEFLDMQTGIMNFPTFSVTNNGYMGFMASNANSLAYQHSSADWSQQKALRGADQAMNITNMQANNTRAQNYFGLEAARATTDNANSTAGWRALQGGANAVAGGLMSGNPLGMVGGMIGAANSAAGYAIDTNHATMQLGINNTQAINSTNANVGNMLGMGESNRAMAQFAANGDYANAIAGINARVQDARMIQPTTSGQMGGEAFNLVAYRWAVNARLKTIDNATRAVIGEFWLRYGYAINRFGKIPSNFQVMTKFTYWKLQETYITQSQCPEIFKQAIRGIFEKGVTVWRNPNDIGNIDLATNRPLVGITL